MGLLSLRYNHLVPVIYLALGVLLGKLGGPRSEPTHDATPRETESVLSPSSDIQIEYIELLRRVFPLHDAAGSWSAIDFSTYNILIVTGPQRSGTTWAACALASLLNYTFYDERHPITSGNDTLMAMTNALNYLHNHNVSFAS